jgi:hypothetical protein
MIMNLNLSHWQSRGDIPVIAGLRVFHWLLLMTVTMAAARPGAQAAAASGSEL